MITKKSPDEIKTLREGGRRLANILRTLVEVTKPGVSALELDKLALKLAQGGADKPAFLGYKPEGATISYPASICISVNDEVVHGIPTEGKVFKEGDIVAIDMGLIHKGLFTDSAITVIVGRGDLGAKRLVSVTKRALQVGIKVARAGNTVGDIGEAIERYVRGQGFALAEGLAGHGVGYEVHEDPYVPNTGKAGEGALLEPGMVIAIEPMLTERGGGVIFEKDGYTVKTKDGGRSAHFEHTIAITSRNPKILTVK